MINELLHEPTGFREIIIFESRGEISRDRFARIVVIYCNVFTRGRSVRGDRKSCEIRDVVNQIDNHTRGVTTNGNRCVLYLHKTALSSHCHRRRRRRWSASEMIPAGSGKRTADLDGRETTIF